MQDDWGDDDLYHELDTTKNFDNAAEFDEPSLNVSNMSANKGDFSTSFNDSNVNHQTDVLEGPSRVLEEQDKSAMNLSSRTMNYRSEANDDDDYLEELIPTVILQENLTSVTAPMRSRNIPTDLPIIMSLDRA